MKHCNTCLTTKPISDLHKKKSTKDGYASKCKSCISKYKKSRYSKDRLSAILNAKKQKEKHRQWYIDFKKGLKCIRCGFDNSFALDFHHRDPNEKYMNVSQMVNNYSKDVILNEIEKCDVLCANCHAIEHRTR
jgi:hypothetical protein